MQKIPVTEWFRSKIKEVEKDAEVSVSALESAFPEEFRVLDEKGLEMTRFEFLKWNADFIEKYREADGPGDTFYLSNEMQFAIHSEVWDVESTTIPPVPGKFVGDKDQLPEDFVKIGGDAEWIQDDDPPICPECDKNMAMFATFSALPTELTKQKGHEIFQFYDAGKLMVFACPDCMEFNTRFQSY